ncbi:MAG: hypothetical protein U9N54_05910 [candidate division Zixibacteria bacterium]|nr:hypothetical protein [candidate division Zixibacteria bacterium]
MGCLKLDILEQSGISFSMGLDRKRALEHKQSEHLGNVLSTVTDRKLPIDLSANQQVDYFNADIAGANDFYPFGMMQVNRGYSLAEYRFGFGGQEKDDEILGNGNSYTAEFWQYDSRLGRRWNTDPVIKDWESPYATFRGNPIWFIDPNGDDPSTHTDEEGNVVAVKDDGDLGVYKHEGTGIDALKSVNENYSATNTSAGGIKMGETHTSLGFADFEAYEKDGTVKPGEFAKIDFGSNWATRSVSKIINSNPSLLGYAGKARGGHDWDIKTKSPGGSYYGSKLYGKYASARDAGNFAAGAIAQKSIVPNLISDYGFGTYNMSGNNVGKLVFMITTDAVLFSISPVIGLGSILYKAKFGEDKLSRSGIEAGKSYIQNQK